MHRSQEPFFRKWKDGSFVLQVKAPRAKLTKHAKEKLAGRTDDYVLTPLRSMRLCERQAFKSISRKARQERKENLAGKTMFIP